MQQEAFYPKSPLNGNYEDMVEKAAAAPPTINTSRRSEAEIIADILGNIAKIGENIVRIIWVIVALAFLAALILGLIWVFTHIQTVISVIVATIFLACIVAGIFRTQG